MTYHRLFFYKHLPGINQRRWGDCTSHFHQLKMNSKTTKNSTASIYRFFTMSNRKRRQLVEAVLWLAICQIVLLLPFRWLAPHLGAQMKKTPDIHLPPKIQTLVSDISEAINRAVYHTPWEIKCLAQAMAGKFMLRCRKIESTLYLGVAKEKESQLKAHAWLRCGQQIVCGERGMKLYSVISTFRG